MRDVRRTVKRLLWMSGSLSVLLSSPVWAAQWDIVPSPSVEETSTDNLLLTPDAVKQDAGIEQLTPAISVDNVPLTPDGVRPDAGIAQVTPAITVAATTDRVRKWVIVPTLSVEETYTDNVSLAPDAFKQDAWITQVTPAISVAATGDRLRFNANYAPQVIYYAQAQNSSRVFQKGNAFGNAELAKKLLFVDFGASINQYNASLLGPLSTSNANTTGNRTTVGTLFASPYLKRDFGSQVQGEARFTDSVVKSDDQGIFPASVADRINLGLNSGPAYKKLTWNLAYVRETTRYDGGQDNFTEVITAGARQLITPTVGLLAKAGYDYYRTGGSDAPASEGPSWSAGLEWKPTPRTRFTATAGQQFYGDAYTLDVTHRTRLTTWSAEYSQYVTNARSEFFLPATSSTAGSLDTMFLSQFPDPVARQKAVEEFIARTGLPPSLNSPINFFSTQLLLSKSWKASVGILGVRNVLMLNAFRRTTQGLVGSLVLPSASIFATSNSVIQSGASLQWNLRVTPLCAWNMGGTYTRNEIPGVARIDNITYVGMGLTQKFLPRVSGSLNYRRQHNDSNQSLASYTENAVFATLKLRF